MDNLDRIQEKILLLLATTPLSTEKIATTVFIDEPLAEFHIAELAEQEYITSLFDAFSSVSDAPDMVWIIEQKGRKYLLDRGLLK
ncbi:hypothetical protein [Nitrosomonas marina]|uniref:Uncharacterized protein n=1 Tax=Nitrosomonas marina TaxID=917 RepID=A0A1H8J4K3_9PROT|nr:hypothetical protein [Nitrosomonas marina]SEN75589.1 hypothetical protein SAMN05216325_1541 [Nitrosomonas marina]